MHEGQEKEGNDRQLKKFSTIIDKHKKRIEEQRAPSHLVQVKVSSLLQDPGASPSAPIVLWCFHSKWRPFRSLHGTPVYLQFLWVFSYNLTQNSHSRIWMRFSMSPRPRNTATTSLMNGIQR